MYPKINSAQTIILYCEKFEFFNIVISPGSRNAPLVIGFASNKKFDCYSVVDERSAGFFALGMSQQTQKPTVLICTSGSALLNYYPAVAEAYYSDIPLIIISADRAPMKLDRVQDRIKSRLAGGLVVDIDAPDLELKAKIIKKKIEEIQSQFKESINLNEEVINYIASESKTNIRELIGVLNRVIAFSRVHNKILTIIDCKNILKDVFNQIRVITVDKIQNTVSNFFNIPLAEMLSQRRSRPLARPRQMAMYLAKKMTTRSLPEIGRRFANRDHTTVIHAVKTITRLSEKDDEMKKNIEQLRSLLLEE